MCIWTTFSSTQLTNPDESHQCNMSQHFCTKMVPVSAARKFFLILPVLRICKLQRTSFIKPVTNNHSNYYLTSTTSSYFIRIWMFAYAFVAAKLNRDLVNHFCFKSSNMQKGYFSTDAWKEKLSGMISVLIALSNWLYFKWVYNGLFLFLFALFKHKY